MKKTIITLLAIALVSAMGLRLKNNHDATTVKTKTQGRDTVCAIAAVSVFDVKQMVSDRSATLVGTLDPWSEITIVAQAQGIIESLNVEAGQFKSKGDVIAKIDNRLKILAFENAKANHAKLKKDLERVENLFKGGTASQQQLDDASFAYENACVQADQAEKQFTDATVESPISGIITKKSAQLGAYATTGGPIATIVDISRLRAKANVSETNVYLLKTGDKAAITTDAYPGIVFEGRVTFVSARGDETHHYPLEITIANSGEHPLKAGTFVTIHIDMPGSHAGLFIPHQALQGSTKDASVYIVDRGKAVRRAIVVENAGGDYLEVLSGLSQGEKVVIAGQVNLSEGRAVAIVDSQKPLR